jgi:hypothetical protein
MEGRNLCNLQAPAPANAAMDGGCSGFRLYPAWPPPRTTSRMLAHGGSAPLHQRARASTRSSLPHPCPRSAPSAHAQNHPPPAPPIPIRPKILPANQIPTPAVPRLGCSTSIPRPARSESRRLAALLQNGVVSARGHLSSLSLPLLHSGVLVKQRRWLGLLPMFLRGCVQGFIKSLAMTVLSEIGDKTFFTAAVRLLPPSPSRHVACSSSCPFACLPCLFLRASLSHVTA